jgi:tetratricopeptide (TPR) repeat protein
VEDIVHKCLARDATARYRDAGELAEDLRRHLANLPLRGVANRSLRERWQKWRRRQPQKVLLAGSVLVVACIVGIGGWLFVNDRLRQARSALIEGQMQIERGEYAPAVHRLQAGWDALRWIPGHQELGEQLQNRRSLAQRASLAQALHALVEQLRLVDSFDDVKPARLQILAEGCGKVWQARSQILQTGQLKLPGDLENKLHDDLLDLAISWAELKMRLASGDRMVSARRDVLRLLDEAETSCGTNRVLALARDEYAQAGDVEKKPSAGGASASSTSTTPWTAWEHFAVGRSLFRAAKVEEAKEEFQQAIDMEPGSFWPNFYQMLCDYRLKQFDEAVKRAYACVALAPNRAECFYNRGLAQQALGQQSAALKDFDRALKLEPTLAVASLHRGMVFVEQRRFADATQALTDALDHGADPAQVHYQWALLHLVRQDRTAALESVQQALKHNADFTPAVDLQLQLYKSP